MSELLVGIGLGIIITSLVFFAALGTKMQSLAQAASKGKRYVPMVLAALIVAIFITGEAMIAHAQTPVPLDIPTDVIFTETNNWLQTFAPIAAIGIGITIAIAVLGYIGKMIGGAFKG